MNAYNTQILSARVVGYEGTSPGPAEGITYRIRVSFDDAAAVSEEFAGVKPCGWRWSDVDVDASALVGKTVDVLLVGGELHGLFVEAPHIVECGSE